MSNNPWCISDISFQQLKAILSDEDPDCKNLNKENDYPEYSTNLLIKKLQEADRKVILIRENAYKTKIAVDYSEVVTANGVITTLARTLDKLVSDLQGLNANDALQQAYENLLYQVGLIKCDMTSENRCKTLHAVRCAIQSLRQLLTEADPSRTIISTAFFDGIKSRIKMVEELEQIEQTIGMFGTNDELSIDDIMDVITTLTSTLHNANKLFPTVLPCGETKL